MSARNEPLRASQSDEQTEGDTGSTAETLLGYEGGGSWDAPPDSYDLAELTAYAARCRADDDASTIAVVDARALYRVLRSFQELRSSLAAYPLHLARACVGSHDVAVHQAWIDGLQAWQRERERLLAALPKSAE